MPDLRDRLSGPDLPERLRRLGFRADDAQDAMAVAERVASRPEDIVRIEAMAAVLLGQRGTFNPWELTDPWAMAEATSPDYAQGVLPLLTLLATAEDVREEHRRRGISDDVSERTLSDLGQQAWVHRRTYGVFGLHTQAWLRIAWSGSLAWLGRLMFNLQQTDGSWVLSTHIPQVGPLTAQSVDESLARAAEFFPRHFPEHVAADFFCASWLLDPDLVAALPDWSNMAQFQRRWRLYGEAAPGDEDALFFTFARRGDVDLDALPQQTTLQRAVVDRLRSGEHWGVYRGRIPMPRPAAAAAEEGSP